MLDKNNIVSMLNTILSFTSCKSDAKLLPTKVSKKVRNKIKDDDNLQITVNQLTAKIEDKHLITKSMSIKFVILKRELLPWRMR